MHNVSSWSPPELRWTCTHISAPGQACLQWNIQYISSINRSCLLSFSGKKQKRHYSTISGMSAAASESVKQTSCHTESAPLKLLVWYQSFDSVTRIMDDVTGPLVGVHDNNINNNTLFFYLSLSHQHNTEPLNSILFCMYKTTSMCREDFQQLKFLENWIKTVMLQMWYLQPEPPLCSLVLGRQCHLQLSALIQRRNLQLQQDVMSWAERET